MQIHGFNKTTLLDFPETVAATIFVGACNFRCPFCHNGDLVLNPDSQPLITDKEVFAHLEKRKGIIKGICITGGEPTLQKDLKEFIVKCREMGLKVKLDTNGYRPEILKNLLEENLLDYVAMDIKSSEEGYAESSGIDTDVNKIKESISLLINGKIPYEFRTTVVRELHDADTFKDISLLLKGADKYFLQGYEDSESVIYKGLSAYTKEEMEAFLPLLKDSIEYVAVRGME